MLKVVVFDSGYGGEFFADQLKEELPIIDIIRVIDWRNADKIISNPKTAREAAIDALRPYIGKVDLIIFANHLLTITSLKYFKRKYKTQQFTGLKFQSLDSFSDQNVLILTTKAVTKTITYKNYIFRLKRNHKTLTLDSWPAKIDDGELTEEEIKTVIKEFLAKEKFMPKEIILGCSQFYDIKKPLKKMFSNNIKIHDNFNNSIREVCKILKIRGSLKKQK